MSKPRLTKEQKKAYKELKQYYRNLPENKAARKQKRRILIGALATVLLLHEFTKGKD